MGRFDRTAQEGNGAVLGQSRNLVARSFGGECAEFRVWVRSVAQQAVAIAGLRSDRRECAA